MEKLNKYKSKLVSSINILKNFDTANDWQISDLKNQVRLLLELLNLHCPVKFLIEIITIPFNNQHLISDNHINSNSDSYNDGDEANSEEGSEYHTDETNIQYKQETNKVNNTNQANSKNEGTCESKDDFDDVHSLNKKTNRCQYIIDLCDEDYVKLYNIRILTDGNIESIYKCLPLEDLNEIKNQSLLETIPFEFEDYQLDYELKELILIHKNKKIPIKIKYPNNLFNNYPGYHPLMLSTEQYNDEIMRVPSFDQKNQLAFALVRYYFGMNVAAAYLDLNDYTLRIGEPINYDYPEGIALRLSKDKNEVEIFLKSDFLVKNFCENECQKTFPAEDFYEENQWIQINYKYHYERINQLHSQRFLSKEDEKKVQLLGGFPDSPPFSNTV